MRRPGYEWCKACDQARELSALVAYWPVGQPDDVRYVCPGVCFRRVVRDVSVHRIASAEDVARSDSERLANG